MRIAIVGSGPTGIYTLKSLVLSGIARDVTIYEMGDRIGVGTPYSPETANRSMLANIASIEIPPVQSTLCEWISAKSPDYLAGFNLDHASFDDRSFPPRLVLGDYFHDQTLGLIEAARQRGVRVTYRESCKVIDIVLKGGLLTLTTELGTQDAPFDKVILATGHVFEPDDDLTDNYFPNPWSGLIDVDVPAGRVGILGTSLSAIDAAMAVATQHGLFRRDGDELTYEIARDSKLKLTLMSWSGILPEADFYCPIPYTPLEVMTDAALEQAVRQPDPFTATYELFIRELQHADPGWSARHDIGQLTPEAFEKLYFHRREVTDPFRWARLNLKEAEANKAARRTVAWRYAILRMHEKFESILPELDEDSHARFDKTLKKVFVDNYAAVPPESIRRLLALRDAGVLRVLPLGDDYDMTRDGDETVVLAHGRRHIFDVFIDARGQRPMAAKDLPFPTLRDALLAAGMEEPEISADYGLLGLPDFEGKLYLAALPYLMQDHPFVQGITACADIGQTIAQSEARHRRRRRYAA